MLTRSEAGQTAMRETMYHWGASAEHRSALENIYAEVAKVKTVFPPLDDSRGQKLDLIKSLTP
eukprot:9900438-Lingulodinium_polyedra.AAC.1